MYHCFPFFLNEVVAKRFQGQIIALTFPGAVQFTEIMQIPEASLPFCTMGRRRNSGGWMFDGRIEAF